MQIPNSITWYPRSHWQRSWRGWCTRPSPDHRRLSSLASSISLSLFLSFSLLLSRHPRQQPLAYAPRAHRIIPFLRVPGISSLRRVLENTRPLNANTAHSCTDCSNDCNLEEIGVLDVARNPRVVRCPDCCIIKKLTFKIYFSLLKKKFNLIYFLFILSIWRYNNITYQRENYMTEIEIL